MTAVEDQTTRGGLPRPGEPAPTTMELVAERLSEEFEKDTEGFECVDRYLCRRSITASQSWRACMPTAP